MGPLPHSDYRNYLQMETLPDDIKMLINEYSSDRVGVHPTARLIKNLTFRHSQPHEFYRDGHESTVVMTPDYFIKRPDIWVPLQPNILRFCHKQYDAILYNMMPYCTI